MKISIPLICLTAIVSSLLILPLKVFSEDIRLGMSAAFQGSSQALGIELYRGAMTYIEHINSQGGIDGQKISIIAYDDSYEPQKTINNTIQLVEKDRVFVLFNYVGTPTVTRMLPLLTKYSRSNSSAPEIYLFFPFTGAQPHRQEPYRNFVFNLRASYRQETEGLVENFVKIGRKRIAVFYQVDAYGRSGWDGVKRSLAKYDLKMVAEATYRRGTPYSHSFQAQVAILQEANPDAIISIGSYAACAGFIRDARNAGWDVPIANISFVGSESLLKLLQKTGKETNKDYTINLINSQVVPSYEDTSLPAVREYRQLMERYNPIPPTELTQGEYKPLLYSFVSFEGFLNAKLLVEILKKMNKNKNIPYPTLKLDDRGYLVTQLQKKLQKEGFTSVNINGIFDNSTQQAAIEFQRSRGLTTDGVVGLKTRSALGISNFYAEPIQRTIENVHHLDLGINARISFTKKEHQGLNEVYYTTIENDQFVPLTNWQRWSK